MGKASKTKGLTTQQRAAAQLEAARQAERRRRFLVTGGATAGVVVLVVALVLVKVLTGGGPSVSSGESAAGTPLPVSAMQELTSVPAATLDAVGAGNVPTITQHPVADITGGTPLLGGGKPEVLYIGGEWCPYCAAMRWAMAVALSRFGQFSLLHGIYSSSKTYFPHTATLTFYKSHYRSQYLTFTPVENETVTHAPLQTMTPQETALWDKYGKGNSILIDIGGKYQVSIIYSAAYLAHQSWSQIATALHNPKSAIALGADGAANFLTAAICKTTGNQPASVCTSATITKLGTGF